MLIYSLGNTVKENLIWVDEKSRPINWICSSAEVNICPNRNWKDPSANMGNFETVWCAQSKGCIRTSGFACCKLFCIGQRFCNCLLSLSWVWNLLWFLHLFFRGLILEFWLQVYGTVEIISPNRGNRLSEEVQAICFLFTPEADENLNVSFCHH